MEITLEKWVELLHRHNSPVEVYNRKVADILSQMLNWILEGNVGITLRNSSLIIDDRYNFLDPEVFGDYNCIPVDKYTEDEDGDIRPRYDDSDSELKESDSVYVAGFILYFMVKADKPKLAFIYRGQPDGAVLKLENSSFDKLVQSMTEANPENRISAKEVLNVLAEQFPSDAKILLVDKDSDAEISTETISLKSAETVWVCGESRREFRGMPYRFCEKKIKLPYRTGGITRKVKVSFFREDVTLTSKLGSGGKFIGIDIGSNRTKVSVLENKKIYTCKIDGEYSIPTAAEYNGNKYYFLSDKEERVFLKRNDDSQIEISRQNAAETFFRKLLAICNDCDGICFTYSGEHFEMLDKVRKDVFSEAKYVSFVSPLKSAGTSLLREKNLKGNVLLVDIGESEARAGIVICDSENCSLEWKIENSISGGRSVTDRIYEKLISHLDAVNIPMRSLGESKISSENYIHNIRTLRSAAEKLKCQMSFSKENDSIMIDIGLVRPDSTIQTITVNSNECGLREVIGRYADDVSDMIKESISRAGLSERNIGCVIINGKAAVVPLVCDGIKNIFNNMNCQIIENMSDITLQARGAAMIPSLNSADRNEIAVQHLFSDIGIVVASSAGGTAPEFRKLLSADTAFINGKVFFAYRTAIRREELEDGCYVLRLYKRDKGCSEKYLNGINDGIKYFGRVLVKIEDDFNYETNVLMFKLWVDTYGKLSAEVTIERKVTNTENVKTLFGKLFGREKNIVRDGHLILGSPDYDVEIKLK